MDFDLETIIKSKITRPQVRNTVLLRKRLHDALIIKSGPETVADLGSRRLWKDNPYQWLVKSNGLPGCLVFN